MKRLEQVAMESKESLLIQAMTFEGDNAGRWLIDIMKSCSAKDKRLLVDSYSKVVINDHFVKSLKYLNDSTFRNEVKATSKLIEEARNADIQVKFTNPVGFFGQKYPLRNHKKMVVVDGRTSFLGGVNFSDHNFSWHDMMVELHDDKLGESLVSDFDTTWSGRNQSTTTKTDEGELYFFNGIKSQSLYRDFFKHIEGAKKAVQIISPYISEPLLGVLRSVAANGVEIMIVSPQENNKSIFKNIILSEQRKGYFQLKRYSGMSHMKAILIDDNKLIFGSSNYDLVSYYFEQEVVFVSEDETLIQDFKMKVMSEVTDVPMAQKFSNFQTKKASVIMSVLNKVGGFAGRTVLRPH